MYCVIEHRGVGWMYVPLSGVYGNMTAYSSQEEACHAVLTNRLPYTRLTYITFFENTSKGYRYSHSVILKDAMDVYCQRINRGVT